MSTFMEIHIVINSDTIWIKNKKMCFYEKNPLEKCKCDCVYIYMYIINIL